jgi:hypothetical protein
MKNNYQVMEEYGRFTIGEYASDGVSVITNDGICQYYWWDTEQAAQAAADYYNINGGSFGDHGYGADTITRYPDGLFDIGREEDYEYGTDADTDMLVWGYMLFDAVVDLDREP